ncbi:MAG: tetratricopeptide repeat protein [Bacteroidota bacterium]|nr:tetratricopeptide repeat protein [Bacteroidota bacterium]MEC7083333.1 tetratricopeptide repeat protein [Bacteroidota bacterium]MEC7526985.1 tetratricopeptide repeat protein [Bacteroidota bacterium]MEC7617914.1 tetratricopeptide repeat protein [Bacteroidota bacterium]MEC7937192.1 tetratricopeptide repeat protein [Bacteroidota bacterium]|tara:strand:- start:2007 stop:3290 length:1284 start_codon:yes stop_codon:yes gene_type:complete
MNKNILTAVGIAILLNGNAQKLQLTEAATEYKNNFSKAWMMQPDQLESNKSVLLKAKKAIDESFAKQTESPVLKLKDETKMYYYRGMIYLDYIMMASMDEGIMKELEAMEEEQLELASFGSLKKCIELDTKNQWKSDVNRRIESLRAMMFNAGAEMFNQKNFEAAYDAFDGSVKMYDVLSKPDTLAMINAALAAENLNRFDEAFNYYKMCADNNYGKGAEMYQSMIRVLNSPKNENKDDQKILSVIEEGKNKFPNDFVLNVEEFNFWYNKGDNEKAQQALQNAIEADPTNKILHFNIGVTYDNLAKTEHEAKNHEKAFEYIEKAVTGYKSAIELDDKYVDAYYNLGALYVNESQEIQSIANDYDGEKYEQEMKRGQETMQKGIPYLEKVLTFTPNDKNTLSVLKIIYANMDDMENYKRIKALLEAAN